MSAKEELIQILLSYLHPLGEGQVGGHRIRKVCSNASLFDVPTLPMYISVISSKVDVLLLFILL